MASSSTSPTQKIFRYDVFLSFRGEDTRKNFVDHLYEALQRQSVHTYKDDEKIKKGKRISEELIESIEDSKFYIIVFSKNYASSSWCLDELVKIMECQRTTEHTAYPVFYDVEPSELRKQSGAVAEAFAKHEKEEAAGKWREALDEAAGLAGWELKNTVDGHEAKLIRKIVEEISLELHSTLSSVDGKLVGMEARIKDVVSSLETDVEDVRMIGVLGMGGGGKTTLARAIFDQISIQFEGKSFVENVREVSKGSLFGLKSLQKQVLSDVLNVQDITVSSVSDGKKLMKKMMPCKRVLVVLDDVDDIKQLEALAGEPNWFKPGSRIIITTRDEQVLVGHRVNLIHVVNLLSHEEAICLFSRYAFGREIPVQGYKELSEQVVCYAAGLPLTIRVLGSFLCCKNKLEWIDALERLKTIPLKETLEKLELSYTSLEEDYKEMFLDVACILKGFPKNYAIRILESCGFHARTGLRVLEQKSLITISEYGYLGMHDHIEEMGRNIVRRLHPDKPSRHSRLWINEEIEHIFSNDLGTEATRYIQLYTTWELHPEIVMKALGKLKELRFLHVYYISGIKWFDSHWKFDEFSWWCFPNALRYLSWYNYPYLSLPRTFEANNLVGLKLCNSRIIQLWAGGDRKVLNKLRFLNLSFSKLRTLDLGLTPNIEEIQLEECKDLVELCVPVVCTKLRCLILSDSMLRTLDLALTPNLEMLRLEDCCYLEELHMPIECLKLKYLYLYDSKLKTFDLGLTPNLVMLTLKECNELVKLHMPAEFPKLKFLNLDSSKLRTLNLVLTPNLKKLSLENCDDLEKLHMPVACLNLKSLYISNSKLRTLDLGLTPNLKTLSIQYCHDLEELNVPTECPKLLFLDLHNPNMRTLHFGLTPNLETLRLKVCNDLEELHIPFEGTKLTSLELYNSKCETFDLALTPNLKKLRLQECYDLVELYMPIACVKLTSLDLCLPKLRTLDLGLTPNLENLCLRGCCNLGQLHMPLACPELKCLYLNDSKMSILDLRLTENLVELYLTKCDNLVKLHMPTESLNLRLLELCHLRLTTFDLGQTPCLLTLIIENCEDLEKLNMPFECPELLSIRIRHLKLWTLDLQLIPNLQSLYLSGCHDLVKLHMPVGCTKFKSLTLRGSKLSTLDLRLTPNLECLILTECYDLVELHAPVGCLKNLLVLHVDFCLGYKSFSFDKHRQSLRIDSLAELHLIAESQDIRTLHYDNNLPKFWFSCFYKEHLRLSTGNLEKLISAGLHASGNLESFLGTICGLQCLRKLKLEGSIPEAPKDLDQLQCLEELTLSSTNIKHLPDSICMLQHLKSLILEHCHLLEELPNDLGRLECLETLILTECSFLLHIPNSICSMKQLKYFYLCYCVLVKKLPQELGRLECLQELNIEGAGISHLPQSIYRLEGLRIVGSRCELQSLGFTSSEIQTSEYKTFATYSCEYTKRTHSRGLLSTVLQGWF